MADWDNDGYDDNYNRGSNRTAGGREATSNFNTTMLSDDGRFLGIKLSPELAQSLNIARGGLLTWASNKGEQYSIPLAESVAKKFTNDQNAFKIAGHVGTGVAYSIILSNELLNVGRNIYDTTDALNNLRTAVRPLSKAGASSVSPLSGNNEVVANARAKINGVFWHRLATTATGAIATLPALLNRFRVQADKTVARDRDRKYEKAKGKPEEIATLLEEERRTGGTKISGSAEDLEKAEKIMLERAEKKYLADHAAYKTANTEAVAKEVADTLATIRIDNLDRDIAALRAKGFEVDWFKNQVDQIRKAKPSSAREADLKKLIEQFQAENKQNISEIAETLLNVKFVQKYGAFDDEWAAYSNEYRYQYGRERKQTHKEKIEGWVEKHVKERQQEEREARSRDQGDKKSEFGGIAAGLGAAVAAELATKAIGERRIKKYSQPIAIDRILHLRRVLEQGGDNPPELVPGVKIDKQRSEEEMSYTRYVHTIFEQHQRDSNRPEIGERFFEHFEAARWEDAAIQQIPDEQLTTYEYAIKNIAKRIKDGRMDAIALINLVGDKEKKIVKDDGRTFGPKGNSKDDNVAKEAILKIIDDQTALAHAGKTKTEGDVNDKLGNMLFSVDDLKKALEEGVLDKQERAFVFTLFSDLVGNEEKLCKMLGLTTQRCDELRKEGKETFNDTFNAAVITLAEEFQNQPEGIAKELKPTEKEKELILNIAEKIKQEGKNAADLVENRQELKTLQTVVDNAVMTLERSKDKKSYGFLSKIFKKREEAKAVIAEAKERKKNEPQEAAPLPAGEEQTFAEQVGRKKPADRFASEEGPTPILDRANRDEPVSPRLG